MEVVKNKLSLELAQHFALSIETYAMDDLVFEGIIDCYCDTDGLVLAISEDAQPLDVMTGFAALKHQFRRTIRARLRALQYD